MIFSSYSEGKERLAGMRLVSCGHIFAKPGREIYRPSGRDDWLLFYVAKEEETFYFKEAITAKAGSFVLFRPGEQQHHIYNGERVAEFYYVHFKCDELPDDLLLQTSHVYFSEPTQQISLIFEQIIEHTLQKMPHYEMLCISLLLQLLSLIKREDAKITDSCDKQLSSIARVVQHMNRYCDSRLTLEEYAAMCYMSKYHFLRVFKRITGVSPLEYRGRIRIEHAKELLKNSFLSVNEISEALGYTSSEYFSYAFKHAVGISPIQYRKEK